MSADRVRRIWLLIAAGAACATALYVAIVRQLPAPRHHISFALLTCLFGFAEIAVVHVECRSQTHTFSLVEVPLVLGLLAGRPSEVVVAQLLGAAAALTLYRRQAWRSCRPNPLPPPASHETGLQPDRLRARD
jgi:hypothetical protein